MDPHYWQLIHHRPPSLRGRSAGFCPWAARSVEAGRLQIRCAPAKSAGEARKVVEEEVTWQREMGFSWENHGKMMGKDRKK